MIRHHAQQIASALADVYRRWQYLVLTLLVAVLIFSANVLVPNYRIISDAHVAFVLLLGAPAMMATASFVMLVIMSVLSGVVASMTVFTLSRQIRAATVASSSILLGVIASSCPSCAIGLAGMLGLSGLFGALPFAGLELGVLGILALLASIFYLSTKITTVVCSWEKKP